LARSFGALALIVASCGSPSAQESWPNRPIKLVVPLTAGGGVDMMARLTAQHLSDQLGQQIVVENQGGAGGTIAANQVARSRPDGYTLIFQSVSAAVVNALVYKSLPYDPIKDLIPVTLAGSFPLVLVANPDLPAKDLGELIALLKANPGKYSYASPGYGTTPHLACEWLFKLEYGIDITHVPFQGAAPAVQSVLAGQTPVFHNVLPAVAPHIRQGTIRALAVAAPRRSPFFPDLPTLAEAGIPGHEVGFWMVVLVAAGTPQPIVDTLNAQVARILDLPDVKERLQQIGFDGASSTPGAAAAHMKAETDKWSKVVRDANIKIE